jgi:heme-degrading monooxygenase HmoA
MRVIVFRSRLNRGIEQAYEQHAGEVATLAQRMPGFVSSKDFVADDGERVSVIEFRSAAELEAWRQDPEHQRAQAAGRSRYFEQYSLQVCELVRESRFTADTVSPDQEAENARRERREPFEGSCLCKAIRYRIEGRPFKPSICHCSMCRRASGAPLVAWATFRLKALEWVSGTPRRFASSKLAERAFCGDCGTALTFLLHAHPDWIDVTLASLDVPEWITPVDHIFTESQIGWVRIADGLPRYPGERPTET